MAATDDPLPIPVPPGRLVTDPARLRWGVVSTIRAPLGAIARFAAWHLDMGAAEIRIFLDEPAPDTVAFFAPHPELRFTTCDEAWWQDKPARARRSHQMRQAFNASAAYRDTGLDWLAHIDVDEFLLTPRPLADMLAGLPADAAFARVPPAEMLAGPDPWNGPVHFKLTRREAGHRRGVLEDIYPEFGAYVPEGFFSHTGGKVVARCGLGRLRFGIHDLFRAGRRVSNGAPLAGAHVGHAHAPSWEDFAAHLEFRRTLGAYRKKSPEKMELQDVLDLLERVEGKAGLRRFYDAMNRASPDLLDRLAAHGMLLTARLDLDARVARRFGPLP